MAERITMASMNTEMGGIISLFPPNAAVLDFCQRASGQKVTGVYADPGAMYASELVIDLDGLEPQISRPEHPEDVVPVKTVAGTKIDSAFSGSCTNGRFEDLQSAAEVLKNRKVAPGVVLKIVPATDQVWKQCLEAGLIEIFKSAGALVGNAGCAGCANGQIGQNGHGEITISTGNRNFAGKQGKGAVYLASPATVAASAVAGVICTAAAIPTTPVTFAVSRSKSITPGSVSTEKIEPKSILVTGRVWVIRQDNIDTDMIFHNRYLAITDLKLMGQYTFDNLKGWEDFARQAQPGDIVVTGKNFGAGSSRQQAVDCFISLGISLIIAESFGAIYERNAINAGLPIMTVNLLNTTLQTGEKIQIDFTNGKIVRLEPLENIQGEAFSSIQMKIYQRGGLLTKSAN
jgi:3-isopropylmalate dehydratase small subunit